MTKVRREVIANKPITSAKVWELKEHGGLLAVHLGTSQVRVYIRDAVGVYQPPADVKEVMDTLDVACPFYFGDVVPSWRGADFAKKRVDRIEILKLAQLNREQGENNRLLIWYINNKMEPSERWIKPLERSWKYREAFEAFCFHRNEVRTFSFTKVVSVRNITK